MDLQYKAIDSEDTVAVFNVDYELLAHMSVCECVCVCTYITHVHTYTYYISILSGCFEDILSLIYTVCNIISEVQGLNFTAAYQENLLYHFLKNPGVLTRYSSAPLLKR